MCCRQAPIVVVPSHVLELCVVDKGIRGAREERRNSCGAHACAWLGPVEVVYVTARTKRRESEIFLLFVLLDGSHDPSPSLLQI